MRKIIQIATTYFPAYNDQTPDFQIHALCYDGTVWEKNGCGGWGKLPPIPQDI